MEEKELWMNKLKEKLSDYSEPAPASGWEQLEKKLMPPVERKIVPYRKWTMAAAAVILLALVSSVSLYFLGTPAADEIRHTQTPTLASTPDALPGIQQPDMKGAPIEPVLRPVAKGDKLAKTARNISGQEVAGKQAGELSVKQSGELIDKQLGEQVGEQVNEQFPGNEGNEYPGGENKAIANQAKAIQTEENVKASSRKVDASQTTNNRPRRPSGKDKYHIPAQKASSQKGNWSMALAVGNSSGASTEVGAGTPYMSRVSVAAVSNGLMSIPNDQTLVFEDGIPYLRQAKQVVDINHHQPISVGMSVRKQLAKGFSLESGLTYTLLSSDAKLADGNSQVEQKLHYIGIPLRANWNFLDKKLITLYVSGGGMVEKCVYGKLGSEKETVKPLQLSVSGAVGAQLNATKHVGLYVEPGVAYFFDDGSDVQTIRKENPFNFNIQAGIRLTY